LFSHLFIGVTDFDRALAFYGAVLGALGLELRFCDRSRPWAGWQTAGKARPLFLIGKPFDGQPHGRGNGQMVAFAAGSRALVDSVYNTALAHGGTSEGAPGLRPEYHADYYGAYFRDPDGNKLCVACHSAVEFETFDRDPTYDHKSEQSRHDIVISQPLPDLLHTARLRLRRPVLDDSTVLFRSYTQDADVCRFMIWRPHATEAETRQFIAFCVDAWRGEDCLPYVITERDADVAIGMIEARMHGTMVDIGYVLAKPHWGRGLMPEAISALAAAAFDCPNIYRVQASCDTDNIASQRALEKSGFVREGRLERHTVHPNLSPEPRACFMYAKWRQERRSIP
jgi:[ribosomal protein S5]-alanine N-acetyltransferase